MVDVILNVFKFAHAQLDKKTSQDKSDKYQRVEVAIFVSCKYSPSVLRFIMMCGMGVKNNRYVSISVFSG